MRIVRKLNYFCIFFTGMLLHVVVFATIVTDFEQFKIQICLANFLPKHYAVLAENSSYQVITIPVAEIDRVMQLADSAPCGRPVNVTQQLQVTTPQALLRQKPMPKKQLLSQAAYELTEAEAVKAAFAEIQPDNVSATVSAMTAFTNRAAMYDSGRDAAAWLQYQLQQLAAMSFEQELQVFSVETGGRYRQPSIVAVLGQAMTAPAIVLGAHMDTLGDTPQRRMPGAGDDASGSATLLETLRVFLASKPALQRPVYFVWYAAEEQGLVGSQQVVAYLQKQAVPVAAALQLDMTGFRQDERDKTMWVFQDYTDSQLSQFVAKLIQVYLKVPVGYSHCGYGCSDHVSWYEAGVPVAFPCETSFEQHNPYIHTEFDTPDLLSLEHMTNFTKLSLAFVLELALK